MYFSSISSLLDAIPAPDETARAAALAHWDALAKPLGSLGTLEEDIARIAAVTGDPDVRLQSRTLLVLCADNGVVARGVTQTDSSVTAVVAKALAEGNSTVCHMARQASCRVVPVDMGMLPHEPIPGLVHCCVRPGTGDITKGPAMTRPQCEQAVLAGLIWPPGRRSRGQTSSPPGRWASATPPPRRRWPAPCWALSPRRPWAVGRAFPTQALPASAPP